MIVMLMSLNVGAQEMEVFDGSYGYMVTNVVNGEKERCCYITKVEPYSQIDLAGISVGTLIVPSDTVNNVYHVGGNKRQVATGNLIELEKGRYLTELETMDLGKYGSISTVEWPLSFHNNTQIYSDPDVSLYDYSTFDFEFTENNVIQQKEISGIIEKELNKKNLKRDRETPDILIYINYYSDKRENYTPPTQEIVTRYKYGYEIGSGWGTRQYVESAEGTLPTWVVGMSIFATFVSSISFLGLPGDAYKGNWNPFVFSLSIPIATWLAAKVFIPLYRGINSVSAYHYLEMRFGYWARCYVAVCYLLTQLARIGSILLLLALPLNTMFGWDIQTIIFCTGIATLIYTLLGGIAAVVWTDAIQGIILIVGAVVCALLLTFTMPEGPGQLFDIALEHDKFSLGSFGANLAEPTFWVVLIYGLFVNMQNYGIDQNYVQRYMTTRSTAEAVKSTLLGGLLYIPVSLVFVYIGTALFSYYVAQPELLPTGTPSDQVFPWFIVHGLPTGLTGLIIASLFSAGMSTVATSINSSATIVLTDFVKRLSSKELSERKSMQVLYVASFLVGMLGVVMGLMMMHIDGILDAWWKLASIFSGGMLGLFLLGVVCRNVKRVHAVVAVILGLLVIAWMSLSPLINEGSPFYCFRSSLHTYLTIVFGTVVIFLTGFLLTKFAKKTI